VTLGALLLRIPSFRDPLFGDEISTHFIVVGNGLGRVLRLVHSNQEESPPLFFILAWATKGLLGNPSQSIRIVSLLAGVAAVPLTYVLGLRTVGRRAAIVGAACVALSPHMIFYSTEARAYMLMTFFALLSTLALLRALDSGNRWWWVAYAAFSCAGFYSHYTVVYLLAAQFVWAFWSQPKARRWLLAANALAVLGCLPWLGGFREDLNGPNYLEPFSFKVLGRELEGLWIGHPVIPISHMPGRVGLALAVLGLAAGLVGLVLRQRSENRWQWRVPPRTALVLVLALAPAVLLTVQSIVSTSVMDGRNLTASWPGLALLIGAIVMSPARPLRLVAVTLTLGAFAIGAVKMLGSDAQRPDIDAAVDFVHRVGRPGDPVVGAPFFANPLSDLDVALSDAGQSKRYPLLRLGVPPLSKQLAALSDPDPQPDPLLSVTPPQEVAQQAVALARRGTIFLVMAGGADPSLVLHGSPDSQVGMFIKALPPGFRMVKHVTYPGISGLLPASVYVFKDKGATEGQ
jgi:mannosyltransferase